MTLRPEMYKNELTIVNDIMHKGFKLEIGCFVGNVGLPSYRFQRFYITYNGIPIKCIQSFDDVIPFIDKISSTEQAMAYIRLFTSKDTYMFFYPKSLIQLELSANIYGYDNNNRILMDQWIVDPIAICTQSKYQIVRSVVETDNAVSGEQRVYKYYEEVNTDGSYQLLEKKLITTLKPATIPLEDISE